MNEILVDENGYNQYLELLEELKQTSLLNASVGSEACCDAVGDGWHDNFAFEETMRESRIIAARIDKMMSEKKYLKIVKPIKLGDEFINIGDTFKVEFKYGTDDIEIEQLTLTGKYKPNTDLTIKEISLNSPIGKAVYKQKVNSTISYCANGNKIEITILNKI